MENPYEIILNSLEQLNNRRTQEVIRLRFGLHDGQPKTLQEIGDKYGITRERVRQIEQGGLDFLADSKTKSKLRPVEDHIHEYLREHGELRRESRLFDDLVYVCFPVKQLNQAERKNGSAVDFDRCRSALNLILTLGEPFNKVNENDDFYPFWTINKNSVKAAKKAVDSAIKHLSKGGKVLKDSDLFKIIKKSFPSLSDKAINSYVDVSKLIEQNYFGDFGLADWPEISPRGVRDKAFLVFKKENKPLHFSEVTNLINQSLSQGRPAYIQTVHNELIKDPRFVLIGRGIYALAEWGYEPGTVAEVITQVLKGKGPLSKEEILKNVMAKRLIKENSVLINLQNKKYFKKLEDGRFALV